MTKLKEQRNKGTKTQRDTETKENPHKETKQTIFRSQRLGKEGKKIELPSALSL
jgi:hypothetical protein